MAAVQGRACRAGSGGRTVFIFKLSSKCHPSEMLCLTVSSSLMRCSLMSPSWRHRGLPVGVGGGSGDLASTEAIVLFVEQLRRVTLADKKRISRTQLNNITPYYSTLPRVCRTTREVNAAKEDGTTMIRDCVNVMMCDDGFILLSLRHRR